MTRTHSLFQHWQTNLTDLNLNSSFTYSVNCRFGKWNNIPGILLSYAHTSWLSASYVLSSGNQPQIICMRSRVVAPNQIKSFKYIQINTHFFPIGFCFICNGLIIIRALTTLQTNSLCIAIHFDGHHSSGNTNTKFRVSIPIWPVFIYCIKYAHQTCTPFCRCKADSIRYIKLVELLVLMLDVQYFRTDK